MTKKVGRNDPCPCGSGKKYKKCCEQRLGPKRKLSASVISGGKPGLKGKASQISTDFFKKPLPKVEEAPKKPEPEEETPKKPAEPEEEAPRKPEEDEPHHPPEADRPM